MKLRVLLLILLALGTSGCSTPKARLWNTQKPTVRASAEAAGFEKAMFVRLNQDRRGEGLAALSYDERLADVARAHSYDMQRHDFFAHVSPTTGELEDRMDRAGYLAMEMRENLATAPTVLTAQDNLLKSPGHRRNILADTVSHIGVGIVRGDGAGDDRVLLITQVFASPASLATPEQVSSKALIRLSAARRKVGLPVLSPHPMLAELAEELIDDLPDDVPSGAVSDIGKEVSRSLNARDDHNLVSVQILAQTVFNAGEFAVSDVVLNRATTSIGIAARKAVDDRGRPRVKVLALVGQR